VRRGPHGPANAEALAAELLALPDRPSAVFAASDTQAMGVLTAADRRGIPVPGQLSVIGFDDIESAALLGLSTIRQPLETSGAEGARRLCALLREERVRPLRQQLALEVVHRSSTASFRMTGPPAAPAAARPSALRLRPDRALCGQRRSASFAAAGDVETLHVVRRAGATRR
jgi:hypothetical protein